jgi:DNA uptake protein ComE-like DNA-binding protein
MNPELSPEALSRLNDKKWRRSQSKWMLWIYLTSSMLGVVGFARIAIKTKNQTAKQYTYILSGLLFVLFLFIGLDTPTEKIVDGETISESGTLGNIGGVLIIVNYALQVYLSLKVNKVWLVFRASGIPNNWVQENLSTNDVAHKPMQSPSGLVKDALGINENDYFSDSAHSNFGTKAPPPPPSKKTPPPPPPRKTPLPQSDTVQKLPSSNSVPLEVNSATVEALMKIEGIDPVLAANIVVQREKNNGFTSFESFATIMNLQPHQVVKLKPQLGFKLSSAPQSDKPGRILDI